MEILALKEFLDQKAHYYESEIFIPDDPVSVPHRFRLKNDIEIAGLLTATISWGNRKSIIKSANFLMQLMDDAPYDFVMHHSPKELKRLSRFVHRTFNAEDALFFVKALHQYYQRFDSLEEAFLPKEGEKDLMEAIARFRQLMLQLQPTTRSGKHIADPSTGSAAKRIHMYLRWMVRSEKGGVDFGLWRSISPALLSCPLDVHTGTTARALGLITRKQNDRRAVEELDKVLRTFDPIDPVKYDFALFGIGMEKKIKL
ncbi:TIGR02757 family protein [Thermaurantimonas aggregans]|uniref:TIGR02757 family protein n=1 Tax=Thermaurantimonas aggregans TaxID=2173829 RepID=A0A401XMC4_9FLAO|nr:TIGR02757 family protein [Thermaurantimonas aggregans]GCD78167.1 TIGR02757 family protein [Thermaurantimonas aggregans]